MSYSVFKNKVIQPFVLLCLPVTTLAFASGIWQSFFILQQARIYHYQVTTNKGTLGSFVASLFFSILIIIIPFLLKLFTDKRNLLKLFKQINIALLPLLILGVFQILPIGFYTPIIFCIVTSLTFFRVLTLFEVEKLNTKILLTVAILLNIGFVLYYWHYQMICRDQLYNYWYDGGIFIEILNNTFNGNFFFSEYANAMHLGVHFSPILLLLVPWIVIFPSVSSFYLLNSIILFTSGWSFYYLGRSLRLRRDNCLLFVIFYMFIPGISNMNRCMGYTFHEISMAIAPIALGVGFYFRKKYLYAVIFFIISLLVKENVAPFWGAMSIPFFFSKRYRAAIFLFLVSTIYYILTIKIILPSLLQADSYMFIDRFPALGNNFKEIALAPVYKAKIFWGQYLRPTSIYYVILICLPFTLLIFRNLLWCTGALFILAISIQQGVGYDTILRQYQTIPLIGLMCAMVICSALINMGKSNIIIDLFSYGVIDRGRKKVTYLILSSLLLTLLCWIFFAQNFFSYNRKIFNSNLDVTEEVAEIKKVIPSNSSLTPLPTRLANFFYFRNRIMFAKQQRKLGQFVLLEIKRFNDINTFTLQKALFDSGKYGLQKVIDGPIYTFLIYERNKPNIVTPHVLPINQSEWSKSGILLGIKGDRGVKCKAYFIHNKQGNILKLLFRKTEQINGAVLLNVKIKYNGEVFGAKRYFADAVYPMTYFNDKVVFPWEIVLPNQPPKDMQIDIIATKSEIKTPLLLDSFELP